MSEHGAWGLVRQGLRFGLLGQFASLLGCGF